MATKRALIASIVVSTTLAFPISASGQAKPQPSEPIEVIRARPGSPPLMIVVAGPNGERIALGRDNRWRLVPPREGALVDIDGNSYRTVRIGWALWMQDNLRVSRFNDGTLIPTVNAGRTWLDHWKTPAMAKISDNPMIGPVYNFNKGDGGN